MLEEIINKISSASGLDENDIRKKINEKRSELSDMVSEEGAAYVVAKELGVDIIRKAKRLNINNVIPGMQNVDILGMVLSISDIRDFETEKTKGRVRNIVIGDETGSVRISLWNEEIDKIKVNVNEVVQVRGYVKEDNMGNPEIRLGRFGSVEKTSEKVLVSASVPAFEKRYERSSISELEEGNSREIRAALLQVFESNPFYEVCPKCETRLKNEDGNFRCDKHGIVEPSYNIVVSGVADDGSDNIRIVLFGKNAEKLLGLGVEELRKIFEAEKKISSLFRKIELGKDFLFTGRVKRNNFFDKLEFMADDIKYVDVKYEIGRLL